MYCFMLINKLFIDSCYNHMKHVIDKILLILQFMHGCILINKLYLLILQFRDIYYETYIIHYYLKKSFLNN